MKFLGEKERESPQGHSTESLRSEVFLKDEDFILFHCLWGLLEEAQLVQ